MGAIDLVVQIEAPPSVASGLQRIGRAGHQVGAASARHHLPEVPRRPRRLRRGRAQHARGRGRGDALSAQPARRAGAADRRDGGDGRLAGRRAVRAGARAPRRSPSSSAASSRACSTCWPAATRPTSSPSCGRASPGIACAHTHRRRARARSAWPSPTAAPSPIAASTASSSPARRRGAGARRRARRGDGLREPRRRDLPARRLDVAHRGDHPRPGDRLAGAGRAGQDAVLEGRAAGPAARVRPRDRRAGPRRSRRSRRPPPLDAARQASTTSIAQAAENLLQYLADQKRGDRRTCPTIAPSSSSAAATSSATGASACSRRSAAGCMAPWSMAILAGMRDETAASTPRRCGPTTASSSASRTPTSRPIRG